jgi:pre-mRNA-processing factor 19
MWTGTVFEKHLLDAYLAENQTDPITNEPATADDYVELKGSLFPTMQKLNYF